MNALITYWDYLWIALFTICIYNGVKIVWVIIESIIDEYLRKKRYTPIPINTFDLLETSHRFEVTKGEGAVYLRTDFACSEANPHLQI